MYAHVIAQQTERGGSCWRG